MAVKLKPNKSSDDKPKIDERKVAEFIEKGSQPTQHTKKESTEKAGQPDYRMILRMPDWLREKIDVKRAERIGTLSRNSLILEYILRCIKEEEEQKA